MELNYEGTLKNAIVSAAEDHTEGVLIETDHRKMRVPSESSGFHLADLVLPDGRNAQAILIITCEESEFITPEENVLKITMERVEQ